MTKRRGGGRSTALAFGITFVVFFSLLGGSVYFLLGDYLGITTFLSTKGDEKSSQQSDYEQGVSGLLPGYVPDESLNMTVLLVGANEREGQASTFMLVRYLPAQTEIILVPLPWQMTATVGTKTDTLAGFSETGIQATVGAVENALDLTVDRYVRFGAEQLYRIVDLLGGVKFEVPMDIATEVSPGVFINMKAGTQLLDGEMITRLLTYGEYPEGEPYRYRLHSRVITALVNSGLQPRIIPLLETMFYTVANNTTTNISATDYSLREDALVHTIEYGVEPARYLDAEGQYNETYTEFEPSDEFEELVHAEFGIVQ